MAPDAARAGVPGLLWGVGGVVLLLGLSVWRLSAPAAEAFAHELGPVHLGFAAVWCAFMVYAEGWRGFHRQFAPRVARRASELPADPLWMALAPVVAMGFVRATRKRRIVSWCLTLGIVGLVIVVRQLPQPWRGLVDLGVVLGLATGTASLLWHGGRALAGTPPDVPPDWPVAS